MTRLLTRDIYISGAVRATLSWSAISLALLLGFFRLLLCEKAKLCMTIPSQLNMLRFFSFLRVSL